MTRQEDPDVPFVAIVQSKQGQLRGKEKTKTELLI